MKKLLISLALLLSITNCAWALPQLPTGLHKLPENLKTFVRLFIDKKGRLGAQTLKNGKPWYEYETDLNDFSKLAEFANTKANQVAKKAISRFLIDYVANLESTRYGTNPFNPEKAAEILSKFKGFKAAKKAFIERLDSLLNNPDPEIHYLTRAKYRTIKERFLKDNRADLEATHDETDILQPNDRALLEEYKKLIKENPEAQFNDEPRKKARDILQQLFENALKQTDREEYLASINDELPKVRAVGEDRALVMGNLVAQQSTTKAQLELTETLTKAMPEIARENAQPFEAAVIQKFLMNNDIKGLSHFMEQLPDNSPFKRGIEKGVPSVVQEALRQITLSVERGLSKNLTEDMLDTLTLNKAIEELGLSPELYRSSANAMEAIAKENVKNNPSPEAEAALEKIDSFIKTFKESFDKPKTWGDKLSDFGTTLKRLFWTKGARGILREQKQIKEIVAAMRQNRTEFGRKVDAFVKDAFEGNKPDYRAIGNLLNELYKRSASEQVIDRVLQSVVEKSGAAFDTPDKRHEALLKILNEVKETENFKERIKDAFYKEIHRNYQDTTVDPASILGADGHETLAQQKAAAEKAKKEAEEQGKQAGKTGENITNKGDHTVSTGVENHEHAAPVITAGQDGKGGSGSQKHSGPQKVEPTPTDGLTPAQIEQQKKEEARQKAAGQDGDGGEETNSGGDEPHAA